MIFYLGTHRPNWLTKTDVPLFLSRRVLAGRKHLPVAQGPWVLDSGGYTELGMTGRWSITVHEYAAEIQRYAEEIGNLRWAAPMDFMCEPNVLAKTGYDLFRHQEETIVNFKQLREIVGDLVAPVLQGWRVEHYLHHVESYGQYGVDLQAEAVVGVGSVCRRGQDDEITRILQRLAQDFSNLHAFGIRGRALMRCSDSLLSADSMAWSYRARWAGQQPGCTHKSCANCLRFALRWREQRIDSLGLFGGIHEAVRAA